MTVVSAIENIATGIGLGLIGSVVFITVYSLYTELPQIWKSGMDSWVGRFPKSGIEEFTRFITVIFLICMMILTVMFLIYSLIMAFSFIGTFL